MMISEVLISAVQSFAPTGGLAAGPVGPQPEEPRSELQGVAWPSEFSLYDLSWINKQTHNTYSNS